MIFQPKKFVGLHSHSDRSIGDAIGNPQDHVDFVLKNGMDALALTDHGNMNGFSSQYLYSKKLKEKGINFKPVYGVEAYYVDSLENWSVLKSEIDKQKAKEKARKQEEKDLLNNIGDEFAGAKKELAAIAENHPQVVHDTDEDGGTVVENEDESKKTKVRNPLTQRSHLVLLAKNSQGLKSLFKLVSKSYIDGFYMYPRIDLKMLQEEAKGNLVATTACIAGPLARIIFDNQEENDWEKWAPNDYNKEKIQVELKISIEKFKAAFGDENFYLELQMNKLLPQHLANYHIIEAAKRTNTKLVITCDAHYSNPEHWREREIYKAMAWSSKVKNSLDTNQITQKIEDLKCELYPKNAEQLWATYKNITKDYSFYDDKTIYEAIERTWSIAHEQIEENIQPDRQVKLPSISKLVTKDNIDDAMDKLGSGLTEDDLAFEDLKRLALSGIKRRNKYKNQVYIDRLVHELKVIKELKFAKYFLTYAKIMEIVGKHMLTGSARGSAGGSLLSYCINITQVDPIRFNLLFERFLVLKKKGWPDIDSDFSDREKAVELIAEYFGHENVISVSNFNQLQLRSLIKDVARFAGIPFEETNKYTVKIETEALNEAKRTPGFDRQQWVLTYDEAEQNSPSFRELLEKYPDFGKTIRVLFKQMRNVSRHAGGVIITENPRENMPMIKSGGVLQTPWPEGLNARHLEDFGFLKFDILGLGTLRIFEECIKKIIKNKTKAKYVSFDQIKDWYYKNLHPDNNPLDDQKVYKHVYWDKNYSGVFQFVQQNVQTFASEMKPTCINDLAIITSLFRPGPLGIQADKLYLNNRKYPKSVHYKHPLLKEVLGDTSGLIVFQEQLQLIYHKLAGVSLEETDSVRKAFTKKDISNKEKAEKDRLAMREDFATKCLSTNNISKIVSYDIFDEMEKFVSYSFNKSHAVAYAINSYQCAWLLTYYPDEWITTYIDYCATEKGKVSGKEDPRAIALTEARALGYEIGKPDINYSERDYVIKDKQLIPSFSSLKHLGTSVLSEINEFRPYKTIENLLFSKTIFGDQWRHSRLNKRAMSTLVKLEAFDSMGLVGEGKMFDNYRQLHYVVVEKGEDLKRAVSKKKKTHVEELKQYIEEAKQLPDWSLEEKVQFSIELSGTVDLSLILTPEIRKYLNKQDIKSIDDWSDEEEYVWCIVKNSTIAKTKKGKSYLRMRLYADANTVQNCFCWNFKPEKDKIIPENSLVLGRFKKSDFGFSCFFGGLEIISQKE